MTSASPGPRPGSWQAHEDGAAEPPPQRRGPGPSRAAMALLGFLAALGCVQLVVMLGVELDRYVRHREAIHELQAEVRALEREAEGLRAIAERGDDDVFLEQLARRQGFVWPDEERLVVIPPEGP